MGKAIKESTFWKRIHANLLEGTSVYRVESTSSVGMPDVNLAYWGREIWLELKIIRSGKIKIRHSQYAWLRSRRRHYIDNTFVMGWDQKANALHVWKGSRVYSDINIIRAKLDCDVYLAKETDDGTEFVPSAPGWTLTSFNKGDWAGLWGSLVV